VSLDDLGRKNNNERASILSKTLDKAIGRVLENSKSPSRKTGELDNRGSHFYLGMYWAQELATQTDDVSLSSKFTEIAKSFTDNEYNVVSELSAVQGRPANNDGYYHANSETVKQIMRPSKTLNTMLAEMLS